MIASTSLPNVLVITPKRFGDARGFFCEVWNKKWLSDAGHILDFVQDNHSLSSEAGTIRGLHYQAPPHAQAKLVRCGRGALFDVAVDIRKGSPTYGQWVGETLTFENGKQLLIPAGFLHGFVTLKPDTEINYKCTDYYHPESEGAVHWDSCGIEWHFDGKPILSEKDEKAEIFAEFDSPFIYKE